MNKLFKLLGIYGTFIRIVFWVLLTLYICKDIVFELFLFSYFACSWGNSCYLGMILFFSPEWPGITICTLRAWESTPQALGQVRQGEGLTVTWEKNMTFGGTQMWLEFPVLSLSDCLTLYKSFYRFELQLPHVLKGEGKSDLTKLYK